MEYFDRRSIHDISQRRTEKIMQYSTWTGGLFMDRDLYAVLGQVKTSWHIPVQERDHHAVQNFNR
jgi:hypothetical protein